MTNRVERLLSLVLMISAASIASAAVYRAVHESRGVSVGTQPKLRYVKDWRDVLPFSHMEGGSTPATVTIIEFADLQCPACRGFQPTVNAILNERDSDVRVMYVPTPLSYHRYAMPAAQAAECAVQFGRLRSWVNLLYDQWDSLGVKSWGAFARDAGIQDTAAIAVCASKATPSARIAQAEAFANQIGIPGTPTVLVNGWMFLQPPSKQELDSAIDAALNGEKPS